MLGPMPPLTGGMATVVDALRHSGLGTQCHLIFLNNGKTTPAARPLRHGIVAQARLAWRVARHTLGRRVDIVHIHTCSGWTFWRDALHMAVARGLGARVIWHVHGGRFADFLREQRPWRRRLARAALERAAAVIVLAPAWVGHLAPLAPRAAWRCVPNGVEVPAAPPVAEAGAPFRILFLGHLGRSKGTHDLVRALAAARRQGFGGVAELAGGESQPGDRAALEALACEVGCQDAVELPGIIGGARKREALRQASVLCLPSHLEVLPMALLEGMAHGLPVLATRVGAIPGVVRDGVDGYLVDAGDVEALAERIGRLAADAAIRRRMGTAAQQRVRQGYAMATVVERLTALYDEVRRRGRASAERPSVTEGPAHAAAPVGQVARSAT